MKTEIGVDLFLWGPRMIYLPCFLELNVCDLIWEHWLTVNFSASDRQTVINPLGGRIAYLCGKYSHIPTRSVKALYNHWYQQIFLSHLAKEV